jgi:Tol biopolymer transport system component
MSVGVTGNSVAWAPTGNVLAYNAKSSQLALVNSDGTGNRVIAPGRYLPSFSWSPDGKYLIAQNFDTLKLDVIDVTTGVALPVGFTGRMSSPSWK